MNEKIKATLEFISTSVTTSVLDTRFARETLNGRHPEYFGAWLCRKYHNVLASSGLWDEETMAFRSCSP